MNTVTIPRNITRGEELVIIPRKEYETFLRSEKSKKSLTDLAIEDGLRDIRERRVSPVFSSAKMAISYLHRQAKKLNQLK
ncbi:MAG: hypothetical protein HYZ69_00585 [Candidatus Colwellbacteria bacterium]|nr:hypothetical protein [Candidatus Colwellbacteria bacterium]